MNYDYIHTLFIPNNMIDIYVFLWIIIKGNACQPNLSPGMFIFKAFYSEIKVWPKDYGYCRLDSSCTRGVKHCRAPTAIDKCWVACMESCCTRRMFLEVKMTEVTFLVRGLRGHLLQVVRSPCQGRTFLCHVVELESWPVCLPPLPLCSRAELQLRTLIRWYVYCVIPEHLWGSSRKKKKLFKECQMMA